MLFRSPADAHHQVVARPDGVVGGQEHGVQVLPGVVAAGVPVLDLHNDGAAGHGLGDGDDLADLVDRKDNEFNTGVTLWKRDWHYWGITPKLSFRFNKVNSNIDDLYWSELQFRFEFCFAALFWVRK